MLIQSTRFGEMDIPEQHILHFGQGIPGFPEENVFAFLPYGDESPFAFLQSASDPDLTFLVVEPFAVLPDYSFELSDEEAAELGLSPENPPQVYGIVSLKEALSSSTVNLLAPVIINWVNGQAKQTILEKTIYTTKQPLFPNGIPQQAEGGE